MRTTMKKLIPASLLLSAVLLAAGSAYSAPLYFPHIAANDIWKTEIAIVNTSDQTISGTLKVFSDFGPAEQLLTLPAHGRRQIDIAAEIANYVDIEYIIFETDSDAAQGYTKFYQEGLYRAAIPVVKRVNASDIYVPHIASNADWWTGISLLNTTLETKELTITFNKEFGKLSMPYTLNANQHKAFSIRELFDNQPQPDIQSAMISNASGVIGLELFGSAGWGTQLEGILLTDNPTTTLYFPHIGDSNWWTGIAAYNTSDLDCTMTITPYDANGNTLSAVTLPSIGGKEKYSDTVGAIGLPANTVWYKIESTQPLSGFELFGTVDGNQLAAYAGGGGSGAKAGVFPKIEKDGWTGIAFANTEGFAASVTLTAYNDNGDAFATQALTVGGHKKVADLVENIFSQDISSATYISYSADRNVVGFQLNGSSDDTMLDGLPGLAGNGNGGGSTCTYQYSQWESCQNGVQTRTVTSATPQGCTGTPVLTQSCTQPPTPSNMVLIPAGSFQMGGIAGEGLVDELPAHAVTLSAFYLDKYEVRATLWDEVYNWAMAHGYTFDNASSGGYGTSGGSEQDQPVHTVSWNSIVKWLNARSEKEGRTPVYYTDAAQTPATVYRAGEVNLTNSMVRWQANGYRLPTEAEWEYAARAGTTTRFYTGDCINSGMENSGQANFDGRDGWYDGCPGQGAMRGGTTPAGFFPANPWGLYDMAGNVSEYTWDWYGSYNSNAVTNPRGPDSGSLRVTRGGNWYDQARILRSASRGSDSPSGGDRFQGFRSALSQP